MSVWCGFRSGRFRWIAVGLVIARILGSIGREVSQVPEAEARRVSLTRIRCESGRSDGATAFSNPTGANVREGSVRLECETPAKIDNPDQFVYAVAASSWMRSPVAAAAEGRGRA